MESRFVRVKVEKVYGNYLVYPACEISKGFARIAGAKSLTPKVMDEIKAMGFAVVVAPESADVLRAVVGEPAPVRGLYNAIPS
jgi:hypothetical protein